eukprot:TRINITY_DN19119_c0_g1_i1.p1 TRINITY_DN19119_c0_g1~~TRINITY_DN19119_c0_g1_i1.p1  ORF type:complete len:1081 (+),score=406.58 TRINITY_DN19119_c0_g1_i1:71-3313(+)
MSAMLGAGTPAARSQVLAGAAESPQPAAHLYEQPLGVLMRHYGSTINMGGLAPPQQPQPYKPPESVGQASVQRLRSKRLRTQRGLVSRPSGSPRRGTSPGVDQKGSAKSGLLPPIRKEPPCPIVQSCRSESGEEEDEEEEETPPRQRPGPRRRPSLDKFGLWARPSVHNGLDHLVASLERLIPRLRCDGFSDKWQAVGEWIDKYDNNEEATNVASHCAQVLGVELQPQAPQSPSREADTWPPGRPGASPRQRQGGTEVQRRPSNQNMHQPPSKSKVITATVVLDVLLSMMTRSVPVLRPVALEVRNRLCCALFAGQGVPPNQPVSVPDMTRSDFPVAEFEAAREEYRCSRKPYCTVADELMQKLGMAANELEFGEKKTDKLVSVMQRGMTFWQWQLMMVIVRAWSAHVKQRRRWDEQQARAGEIDAARITARAEVLRLQRDIRDMQEKHAVQLEAMREQLEQEKEDKNKTEEQMRMVMIENDMLLKVNREGGTRQLAELREQLEAAHKELDSFRMICRHFTVNCCEGHPVQVARQHKIDHVVSDYADRPLDDVVIEFLNSCIDKQELAQPPIPDVKKYRVSTLSNGMALLEPYGLAMQYFAPDVVSRAELDAMLAQQTVQERAAKVVAAAAQVGMRLHVPAAELAKPHSATSHLAFSAALFARFADPLGAARLTDVPPSTGQELVDGGEHPLWPCAQEPTSAQQWEERISQAWARRKQWVGAAGTVLSSATQVLLSKATGGGGRRELSEQEQAEMQLFVTAPTVFDQEGESQELFASTQPRPGDVESVQQVLRDSFLQLRGVFGYYAGCDIKVIDGLLSTEEFWKMLSDCKLTTAKDGKSGLSRAQADEMFRKVAGGQALDQSGFCKLLFRLAAARVKGNAHLSEKLRTLLDRYVLPNSNATDVDEFREQVYQPTVQTVLASHRDLSVACFRSYCRGARGAWMGSTKTKDGKDDRRMGRDDFAQLVTDLTLTDSVLTQQAVKQIFIQMVQGEGAEEDPAACGLSYGQFLECLCCIAAFKSPAPYLPLSRRVARFFDMFFVPMLSDTARFKKVHDELIAVQKMRRAEEAEGGKGQSNIGTW